LSRAVRRVALERASAIQTAADPERAGGTFLELAQPSRERGSVQRHWLKRFGAVGFALFLLKGLFWLTVPALLAYFGRR
jgi:hypothetical protein